MSNPILTVLDDVESLPTVARHIVQHDMSGQFQENVYADMVRDAVDSLVYSKESWEDYLRPYEEMVLSIREKAGETGLKTKAGKWKLSKVSHNSSYRSNKSVIGNALDKGLHLYNEDGAPKPKSQLEREIKGIVPDDSNEVVTRVRRTPYERCLEAITSIIKLSPQCSPEEQDEVWRRMREIYK